MSVKPEIELTADGSHTLFVPALNEHYHSVNGAMQESTHIFINAGLHRCEKTEISIFEVGFGTGLNAFLTLLDNRVSAKTIHYTTIEVYPLSESIIRKLNYADKCTEVERDLFYQLHTSDWDKEILITNQFYLTKLQTDFTSFDLSSLNKPFDVIYFDAFAPEKQADMWSQDIFDNLYSITAANGILVTYCAKGIVRRMMQQAGYKVERLPGPPGKREMLRAIKY
ncbi:MAG: tRNA (5-methylaminomethyl-2-thiouridine)(34)-methyltransferase MnmD [Dysgonomonas sp.]